MLTARENLLETIRGGKPERYVNQYEFLDTVLEMPFGGANCGPGETGKSAWGVTFQWAEHTPGRMPVHDPELIVMKDIEHWRDYVKAPVLPPEEAWADAVKHAESVNRKEQFCTGFVAPGLFEQCHYLSELQNCLCNFITNPDEMHEMIDYITEWELRMAEQVVKYVKPDAIFHHDDWGTQISTFLAPDMFAEFFLEPYKKIYGYYKSHGVELIVHHCDSYAATLVPYMIEMGVDIWQGAQSTNDIPALLKQYGGKLSIMAGIDSGIVDKPDWSREEIRAVVRDICDRCGKHYFIPCLSQGLYFSTYPGVYETTSKEIAAYSKEKF